MHLKQIVISGLNEEELMYIAHAIHKKFGLNYPELNLVYQKSESEPNMEYRFGDETK